jgi:3-deoxy-7-phosphoheptulonate synthase
MTELTLSRTAAHEIHLKNGFIIGGRRRTFMLGPCSVENEAQVEQIARQAAELGAPVLRGGAFKPRTSPHTFQGLGWAGLDLLVETGHAHGLAVISEVMDPRDVEIFLAKGVDILQIGSRNMQNFPLLKEAGRTQTPVMIKRGFMSTIKELLYAAEYVLLEGNTQVILCERGIRTFETLTRNTLDLTSIPLVKSFLPVPVIADLSHALGRTDIMLPMAKAALACGADGLMLEIHPDPSAALSDGDQALSLSALSDLMSALRPFLAFIEDQGS